MTEKHKLRRILGVPFGVAVIVGGTVGVGILRSPGAVAEHLNSFWMIALVWVLGGVYSLLGANYMAELASSLPSAGGPYVYARRAFGDYGGFVVGWGDWLLNVLSLSYMCIVFGEYSAAVLSNDGASNQTIFAVAILSVITALNWIGVRAGSGTQQITSAVKAIALLGFVAVCFIYGGNGIAHQPNAVADPATVTSTFATLTAFVLAFQLVLGTYSGWFSCVYFAEEDVDPARNISRSLFGGIAVIIVIYVLVNLALLYVLPLEQLAGSKFAAADAMTVIFGSRSGQIVTTLAILSIVGITNWWPLGKKI